MRFTRITIMQTRRSPSRENINEQLQWFGGTIGLFSKRDKDKSCFRIFITLLKNVKASNEGLTSDEIAALTKLTRGTVIHHITRLMEAGIVTVEKNKYVLQVENLEELVELLKQNVNKTFENLKDIAKDIDDKLEL
jgi:predicted transcriptional regulator